VVPLYMEVTSTVSSRPVLCSGLSSQCSVRSRSPFSQLSIGGHGGSTGGYLTPSSFSLRASEWDFFCCAFLSSQRRVVLGGRRTIGGSPIFLVESVLFRSAPVEVGLGRTERKEIKHGDSAYSAAQGAGRSSLDIDVTAMMHIPCGRDHPLEN
jgi:hypothetical protein